MRVLILRAAVLALALAGGGCASVKRPLQERLCPAPDPVAGDLVAIRAAAAGEPSASGEASGDDALREALLRARTAAEAEALREARDALRAVDAQALTASQRELVDWALDDLERRLALRERLGALEQRLGDALEKIEALTRIERSLDGRAPGAGDAAAQERP